MQVNNKVENEVAEYYNHNTARFLRFRRKNTSSSIHRRLYPEIRDTKTNPESYSDSIVLNLIIESAARSILDLGCGVGGSIRYLESRHEANYTGITLSPIQCKIAEELGTKVELGSYLDTQWYKRSEEYDLVYAIESLQHNPNHGLLVDNLKSVMKSGSYLIVIDDFLKDSDNTDKTKRKLVGRFKKHWHAHGYTSIDEFINIFESGGLHLCDRADLTGLMKKPILNRHLRSVFLSILSWLPIHNSALDNILGGGTLLLLQQLKLSGYYKLVFRIN